MQDERLALLAEQALVSAATLAAPVILVAAAVGFVVALLQAATQIQEQTVAVAAKLASIATVVAWIGASLFAALIVLTRDAFGLIAALGG